MDINTVDSFNELLQSPQDVMLGCAQRLRALRLEQNLTQQELAKRVGIAIGTVKRFEKTGEIQFNHLLRLALVLGRLDEFKELFHSEDKPKSLFELEKPKVRQRARRK